MLSKLLCVCAHRLPYVEATILEVLRYKTLAPLAITHCTLNDTEVGGYFVPAETTVCKLALRIIVVIIVA